MDNTLATELLSIKLRIVDLAKSIENVVQNPTLSLTMRARILASDIQDLIREGDDAKPNRVSKRSVGVVGSDAPTKDSKG